MYCYLKQEEAILAAKNERSQLDQRPGDATDTETPPSGANASKSLEKTSAPPPSVSAVTGAADASPPDGKAANGTGTPVDKNVENRTAGPGNDSEKAPGSLTKDGKPAENDGEKLTKKPEKPSSGAEPRPEENASGTKKPDEQPGNADNESANPAAVEKPSTN